MLVAMRKRKSMKAKLALKNKQMAPGIICRTYRLRKKHPPTCPTQVNEKPFSPVPGDVAQRTPLKYFKQFWDDEITNMLVKQTNLYSVEQSGVNINTNKDEIEKLVAVQMLMSTVKMPR